MLCEYARQTNMLGYPAEYFNPNRLVKKYRKDYVNSETDYDYIERVIQASTSPNGVFGTKLHASQRSHLLSLLAGEGLKISDRPLETRFPNLHYIHLERENKVRQAISYYRAMHSQVWWKFVNQPANYQYAEPVQPEVLEFNFDAILGYLNTLTQENQSWVTQFQLEGITPLHITYEELSEDPSDVINLMMDFLEVPRVKVSLEPNTIQQSDALTDEWEARFLSHRASVNQVRPRISIKF